MGLKCVSGEYCSCSLRTGDTSPVVNPSCDNTLLSDLYSDFTC